MARPNQLAHYYSALSHTLNNELMVVYSQIDIIKQGAQLPGDILLKHCEILSKSSQKLARLIEQFRRFSTSDSVPQDYNLKTELSFLSEMFNHKWKLKSHRLVVELEALDRVHRCDIGKLINTLLELVHGWTTLENSAGLDFVVSASFSNHQQIIQLTVLDQSSGSVVSAEKIAVDPKDLFAFSLMPNQGIQIDVTWASL